VAQDGDLGVRVRVRVRVRLRVRVRVSSAEMATLVVSPRPERSRFVMRPTTW